MIKKHKLTSANWCELGSEQHQIVLTHGLNGKNSKTVRSNGLSLGVLHVVFLNLLMLYTVLISPTPRLDIIFLKKS